MVAAGSIVTSGTYPPNVLLAGSPARVLKQGVGWRDLTPAERRALHGAEQVAAIRLVEDEQVSAVPLVEIR